MKRLVLVTADEYARESLSAELRQVLEDVRDLVRLEARSLEALGPRPEADLCLVSTPAILDELRRRWGDLACPVMVCRRSFDPRRIKPLLDLPRGTPVLLVILFEQDAIALRELLQEAGLGHLVYIPWSPGSPVPEHVTVAVTPGKRHLVPGTVKSVIDIGTRTIDVTTVVEILYRLQLDRQAERLSVKWTKEMVALYRELLAGGSVKPGGSLGHVARYTMDDILGESPRILEAKALAQKMARTDGTVLLLGESGVGKEMFAQAIHNASRRAGRPFVAVNFSALPETLMESELFGYEEGAFTGARKGGKAGLLELADGGTVFLDEIGDASPAVQVRLLRVLQEKQILRVGGTRVRSLDIRVIAATHRDLAEMVESGQFRRDLYYRLAVFPLEIPPLRERLEDVFRLFLHFLGDAGRFRFDPRLRQWLTAYSWPGNVRELQNCALYVQGVAEGKVGFAELPPTLRRALAGASGAGVSGASGAGVSPEGVSRLSPAVKGATDAGSAGSAAARSARSGDAGARKGAAGAARSQNATGKDAKREAGDAGIGRDLGWLDGQPVLLEILALLAEAGPTRGGLGRRALAERVTSERLTAEQVRSRLKVLQDMGLVAPARGRQGTMITPLGLAYLQRRRGAGE